MADNNNPWEQAYAEDVAPASEASKPADKASEWESAYEEDGGSMAQGYIPAPYQKGIEKSKYDEGYLTSFGDINKFRAQRQTFGDELANKTAQVIPGVVMGTFEILGYMGDAVENIGGAVGAIETDFDNWLSKGLREAEEKWDKKFPVYSMNPNKVFDFGDTAWWINNGGDTVESIMEFLAAGAITGGAAGIAGKGLQGLGVAGRLSAQGTRLANITNKLSKAVYAGGAGLQTAAANSIITAQGIGALNAHQVYKDIQTGLQGKVNPHTGQIYTQEELNTLASQNAAGTFKMTALASTLLNMTTLTPFSKGARTGLNPDKAIKSSSEWLKKLKSIKADPNAVERGSSALKWYQKVFRPGSALGEMTQEGVEEINENWQQQLGVHRALRTAGQESTFDPFSQENILAFALGAFGGAVAKGGGSLYSKLTDNTQQDKFEGLLDKQIASIEDFNRFAQETRNLNGMLLNPKLSTEQREKINRDYEQKLLEWQATAAEAAMSAGSIDLLDQELKAQLEAGRATGELMEDEEKRINSIITALDQQRKVRGHLNKIKMPSEELNKLAGWTSFMVQGTKNNMSEHQETVSGIYEAVEAPVDIQINTQIAALEHIIKSSSDNFVKTEAKKKLKDLKQTKSEIEGAGDITNEAAFIAEARKFNSMFLNQKYREMNTSLMFKGDRDKVLEDYHKERKTSEKIAAQIAQREEVYGQIDEYLAQDLENMTVSELKDIQKQLKALRVVKSPFVEDTLRDTKKLEATSRGVGLTLEQLNQAEKEADQKEDTDPADEKDARDDAVEKAIESKEEDTKNKKSKTDQQDPEDFSNFDPLAPGTKQAGQGVKPPEAGQKPEPKPEKPAKGKRGEPKSFQSPSGQKLSYSQQQDIKFSQGDLTDPEGLPVGVPIVEEDGDRRTKESNKGINLSTVLKGTVQLDIGSLNGKRVFMPLVNDQGNSVEQRYVIGQTEGGAQEQFDFLYTEKASEAADKTEKFYMDVYETEGTETIDGQEYGKIKLDSKGNPILAERKTYYLSKWAAAESRPASEVFKTIPETGELAINDPSIKVGTGVTIIAQPNWEYWKSTDPETVALNVYLDTDLDENGDPREGALPLTQVPSTKRRTKDVGPEVSELRSMFAKDMGLKFKTEIASKTAGNFRKMKSGGSWQEINIATFKNGYVKVGDAYGEYTYRSDNEIPILIEGKGDVGVVPEGVWERLSSEQKATLGDNPTMDEDMVPGVFYSVRVNPAGVLTTVRTSRAQVTEDQAKYLFSVPNDTDNVFNLAMRERGSGKGTNYLPGLTENFQITPSKGSPADMARNYKDGMINFTGVSVLVKIRETSGEDVIYSIPTNILRGKGRDFSQFNDMINGKKFRVEKFTTTGEPIYVYNADGTVMKSAKGDDVTYFPLQGNAAKAVRTAVGKQFMQTRRNVSNKLILDGRTEYRDKISGKKYNSYLDYILETGALTTSVPADAPFEGVGVWLGNKPADRSDTSSRLDPTADDRNAKQAAAVEETKKTVKPKTKPEAPKPKTENKTAADLLNKFRKDMNAKPRLVMGKTKGFKKLNKAELDWFKDIIGDQYLSVAQGVDTVLLNGKDAFGFYHNAMVTIAEGAATGTAYHEAFHFVFDLALTPRQQKDLLRAARKKYKGGEAMSDLQLEEAMADDFMNYRFNRESYRSNSVITRFFRMIRNYINNLLNRRINMDSFFRDISDGNFEISSINNNLSDLSPRPRLILESYTVQETAIRSIKKRLMDKLHTTADQRSMSVPALASIPTEVDKAMAEVFADYTSDRDALMTELEEITSAADFNPNKLSLRAEGILKRIPFLEEIINNWGDTNIEGYNPRDGLESMTKRSLASNGFSVRVNTLQVKEDEDGNISTEYVETTVTPPQTQITKAAEDVDDNTPADKLDLDGDTPSEIVKDRIYDQNYVFENPKSTLSGDVKAVLGNLTHYQVLDGELVKDENNKPIPKLNEYGEQELIGNFDDVYAMLRDKLADVPMESIHDVLKEQALIHDEFAIILDALNNRKGNGSEFYAKFMSHFHADKKKFITILHESDQSFKILETNRADLANQIADTWKSQATFLSDTEEGEILPDQAKEAWQSVSTARALRKKFKEIYTRTKLTKLTPAKKLEVNNNYADKLIDAATPAMKVLGIEIEQQVWDDLKKVDPEGYRQKVEGVILALDKTNPGSVEQMAKALTNSLDPYDTESNKAVKKLVDLVKDYEIDNFTASFINGEKKTVYGINLHNHLSKTMRDIQNDPMSVVNKFFEDSFYNPGDPSQMNYFLQQIQREAVIAELDVYNFDTIKTGTERALGVPYDKTNNQESIISRLLAFNNNEGGFGLINTGTKADKGQSIYIKLPKLSEQQIDDILKNTAEQERVRINRIKNHSALLPDSPTYKANGSKFLYIPALNDVIGAEEDLKDPSNNSISPQEAASIEEKIKETLDSFKENLVQQNLAMLEEEGVIKRNKDGNLVSDVIPSDFHGDADLETRLREFILNDFAWNMEMGKVFMGDLAFYSSKSDEARTTDYFKRAYQTITPGNELFISKDPSVKGTTKSSLRVLTMKDPILKNSKEYLKALTKGFSAKNKEAAIKAYGEFDSATDAMSYITVRAWKELHLGFGTWTTAHEEFYINAWARGIDPITAIESNEEWITASGKDSKKLTSHERKSLKRKIRKVYLEAIKPFYYGNRNIPLSDEVGGNVVWFEQYKMAMVPIFPEFARTRPNSFGKLLSNMERHSIDATVFDSAIKVGGYNSVDSDSDAGTWTDGPLGNIKTMPLENYRVPQKISTKEGDSNAGTQMQKIITGNLKMGDRIYSLPGKQEKLTGEELTREFNNAWGQKIKLTERKLKKALNLSDNLDGDWSVPTDPEKHKNFLLKLRSLLDSENIDRQLHENYEKNMEIVKTGLNNYKFAVPIDFPAFSRKYESILMSLFRNRILRQKFPGASMVQMADYDTQTDNRLQFVKREDTGMVSAEIAVPQWFLWEKLKIKLPVGKISAADQAKYKKQLEMLAFRIPTQGKNSMLPMHIAEILPETQGSTVMVPAEITVQMGSDFDIDKLFLMTVTTDKEGNMIKYSDKVGLDKMLAEKPKAIDKVFESLGLNLNNYDITETNEEGVLCS